MCPMAWGKLKARAWPRLEKHHDGKAKPLTEGMTGFRDRRLRCSVVMGDEVIARRVWDSLGDRRNFEVRNTGR